MRTHFGQVSLRPLDRGGVQFVEFSRPVVTVSAGRVDSVETASDSRNTGFSVKEGPVRGRFNGAPSSLGDFKAPSPSGLRQWIANPSFRRFKSDRSLLNAKAQWSPPLGFCDGYREIIPEGLAHDYLGAKAAGSAQDRSNHECPGFRPNGPDKSHRQGQRPWSTKPSTSPGLKGRPFDESLAPETNGRAVGPEFREAKRRPRPLAWAVRTNGPLGRKSAAFDMFGDKGVER